jgi:RND family efflux transporter MFP subunit
VIAQLERPEYEARLRQAEALLAQARARLGITDTNDTVEIDQSSAVQQALAVEDEARRNRERVRSLAAQQIASEADLNSADAAYQVALNRVQDAREETRQRLALLQQRRAELDIARQQLIETTLIAPFDGVIESRVANPGELLSAGAPVAGIVRVDPLRLRLEVPERDAPKVKPGQAVRVTVEGDPAVYAGKLTRLSPVISDQSRMLLVEADVPNPGSLRPGQFARAAIITETDSSAVTVPVAAVRAFAGLEQVFAVEDGKAVERTITAGKRTPEWVEVVRGVAAGETLVMNPGGLQNGQPVVTSGTPPQAAAGAGAGRGSD